MADLVNVRARKIYSARNICIERDYFNLYRFREESVKWLADYFIGDNNEHRGAALTPQKQMEIFLRFLSDPGFQIGIGKEEGVHRSTVCKVIKNIAPKIAAKASLWIKFPKSTSEIKNEQDLWTSRFQFPFAIGALDCTHVEIQKPTSHGDEYVNRKGFCSVNVQATCNANEEFTSIDAQWPGSVHDSRILKQSSLFEFMNKQKSNAIILGDLGYGIRPWLLTPFKGDNLNADEERYNKIHKKCRVIIERCFGQLKRRFPILQYKIRVKLNKIPSLVICCVILHNISKFLNDPFSIEPEPEEMVTEEEDDEDSNQSATVNAKILGERRRQEIKNILRATI